MNLYFPYGLVAIGMSMYVFYTYRKKRKEVAASRRHDLKDARQEWLDHQLRRKTSDIILYSQFMEQKITSLKEVGINRDQRETYYFDEVTNEKWIKEHPYPEMHGDGPPQLRKVKLFPFDDYYHY